MGNIRNSDLIRTLAFMPVKARWVFYPALIVDQAAIAFFLNIILAFIMKYVLDAAVQGEMVLLERAVHLAVSALFVGVPLVVMTSYLVQASMSRTHAEMRKQVFDAIISLEMSVMDQSHSGNFVSLLTNDIDITQGLFGQIRNLLSAIMFGFGAIGAIFVLDARFGFLVFSLGLLTVVHSAVFARPLRDNSDTVQKRQGISTERLIDLLNGVIVTKMFHVENHVHSNYINANQSLVSAYIKQAHIKGMYYGSDDLMGNVKQIGVLALGLYLLLTGDPITVGTIAAIIHLQGNAGVLFSNIGDFITGIQSALAGAHRVFQTIESPRERVSGTKRVSKWSSPVKKAVSISDLEFQYGESENKILNDLNIVVEEGQFAALVGPSGGGKSTTIKLLLGLYPFSKGRITIGGCDIREYEINDLRSKLAYVPQDAYVFNESIEENIRYGKPGATFLEIEKAAIAAYAHEFITDLPAGYATRVGERGVKLSGGERQRISIARALLKDAPILLLDEATSSLDSASERVVQSAIDALMVGRTTIAIAHRLSTIEHADVIYVLDGGRVLEKGNHESLLNNKNGIYFSLLQQHLNTGR